MSVTTTANRPAANTEPLPRIRDPRLLIFFRAVWILFAAVALIVTVVSIPAYIQTCNCSPQVVAEWERLGIAQGVRIVFAALTAVNMTILLALSTLIFWRRPDDAMAIYVSLTSLVQGVFLVAGPQVSSAGWYTAVRMIDNFLTPLSWIGLFFLFPTGRFYPSWSRWLLLALVTGMALTIFLPGVRIVSTGVFVLGVVCAAVGLWAMRRRYLQAEKAVQRQQIKWPIFALTITVILLGIGLLAQSLLRDAEAIAIFTIFRHSLIAIAQMLIPASIAFAMLRYRLWDIDVVINRAVVSGIVTLGLAVLFVLEFFVLHLILMRLMVDEDVYISVAVPAAITALLFSPARKRVRSLVDRRLYGFRFDLNELKAAQADDPITNPGLLSGKTVGAYKLLDVIGRGGMGEVYKGVGKDQTVAIKILPQELANQEEPRARFKREADALTALAHPNIVRFYEYGAANALPYMAMQLVEGEELTDRLKREKQFSLDEVQCILSDLASALDYAHGRGLVHRDIKPSNVMLARETDGATKAVLMDFGIAKIQNSLTSLTGSGAIGTIDYMSPEQIMESRQVDRRSDVYALGVLLYLMLTGELPFKGNPAQILFAHLQQPVPDPRVLAPDLPHHVAYAIMKALSKTPEDRFESAGELALAFMGEYAQVA